VNLTKFESTADIDEFCQQRPPGHNQDHVEQQETNARLNYSTRMQMNGDMVKRTSMVHVHHHHRMITIAIIIMIINIDSLEYGYLEMD